MTVSFAHIWRRMGDGLHRAREAWRRRWWRPDRQALAAYDGLRPMTVVTGGSRGIGYALAREFAAAGNDLLLIARRNGPLVEAAHKIRADFGVEVETLSLDITSPGTIQVIDAALAGRGAYADVLVNSAGIGLSGPFASYAEDDLQRLADLNVRALSLLSRHYLPGMCIRGRGGILNLASLGSYTAGPNQAAYYASKAYVISLTEAIADETAGQGVRVSALAPGPVDTEFHKLMGAETAFYRMLVPPFSPEGVARIGYRGFSRGWRVIVPGFVNTLLALALRILPHRIMIPIVGWLLKPRGPDGRDARRQISRQ